MLPAHSFRVVFRVARGASYENATQEHRTSTQHGHAG